VVSVVIVTSRRGSRCVAAARPRDRRR
jgi:hypothetical protein